MWESDFGFKDRKTANANIKVKLREYAGYKYISVQVDEKGGEIEDRIKDESLSKERLADKPFKFLTECGRHLSVGFNLEAAQLTLKHNGDDVEKLPEVKKVLNICRNKITKSSTSDQRYVSLILISILPRLLIIWRALLIELPSFTPSTIMSAM